MERSSVSVEDFQDYHNHPVVGDADGIINSSPIATKDHTVDWKESRDDTASLSGSTQGLSSGADDEAVFDAPFSGTSSPRTSHGSSDEEISVLESAHTSSRQASGAPFTPSKTRSPFHHPSSVRAMQLDTTPPHLTTPSSQRKRLYTPSRQTSTPRSARSHRATPSKLMNSSPIRTTKKEHPLVLLHITLLPLPHQYSPDLLQTILPPTIFANWKLLLEKATLTVFHRGVLIPHPREDYDLLEERLLESLELKQPRILKCGHFHLSPEQEAEYIETSEEEDAEDLADADICDDCGRRVRDGRFGDAGTGSKRWDVKVFAANGLMRAGAWSAAWREMERIDVEILPWMEESMKRELEFRHEEEEKVRREGEARLKEEGVASLDDERLREIYGQDASMLATPGRERGQEDVDGLLDERTVTHPPVPSAGVPRSPSQSPFKHSAHRPLASDIPLATLLYNYLYLAAQDPRNIAIWALSALVLIFSIRAFSSTPPVPVPAALKVPAQMTSTAVSTTVPTVVESVVKTMTNGGGSMASVGAEMASTMAGVTATTPEALAEAAMTEQAQTWEDGSGDEKQGEKGNLWMEAVGDAVSELLED